MGVSRPELRLTRMAAAAIVGIDITLALLTKPICRRMVHWTSIPGMDKKRFVDSAGVTTAVYVYFEVYMYKCRKNREKL